jgi:uncharacterized protein YbjT (DUF2867 family)
MTILVTGARGNVGRKVVEGLVAAGADVRVSGRSLEGLPTGLDTVQADVNDPRTLPPALAGVTAVFLYAQPDGIDDFLTCAKDAGVAHIVLLSSIAAAMPDPESSRLAMRHVTVERAIAASGLAWTFLRPGAFATNTLAWAPAVREGVIRLPYADAQTAPIHEADIADAAVSAFTDERHRDRAYEMTGPESLTLRRQVRLLAEAVNHAVRVEDIPEAEAAGIVPAPQLRYLAASQGRPAAVNDGVYDVTGKPARTYGDWARDHAADYR